MFFLVVDRIRNSIQSILYVHIFPFFSKNTPFQYITTTLQKYELFLTPQTFYAFILIMYERVEYKEQNKSTHSI